MSTRKASTVDVTDPLREAAASASPKRSAVLCAIAAGLSLIGLADAIYLTAQHLAGRHVRCAVSAGCSEVLASPYAAPFGVPLASLGAAAYFTAFSLATLAAYGYATARTLLAALAALMLLATLWLLYVQAFVLRAFCDYCLLSAGVVTLLTATVVTERLTRSA